MASVLPLRARACTPHPFAQQHLKLFRPSKFGSERSGVGPEFEKGDGRLRPSLQQRLPGAEGPPEGCSTAPRHAACGGPIPSSARAVRYFLLAGERYDRSEYVHTRAEAN